MNNWRFSGKEKKYLNRLIEKGLNIPGGSFKTKLEKKWSNYHNLKFSIAINSCTSALHTIFLSLGLKKNEEVLVPVLTPVMCATTIHLAGLKPIYVDVNKDNFLLDENDLKKKITKNSKAILAVHMYSGVCDLKNLKNLCKKYKLYLIEDCAEAFGAYDKNGLLTGTVGDISCWSFQSAKQLTSGDGGIIATNSSKLAKKMRKISNLGFKVLRASNDQINISKNLRQNPNYARFDQIGYNYRMSEFSAAVALGQLENSKFLIDKRRNIGEKFRKILINQDILKVQNLDKIYSSFYTFAVFLSSKKISWKKFRKIFMNFGGEPFYAASKLLNQEKAIINNLIGRCFKTCNKHCIKNCHGTPVAKKLQKKLILFTTNQGSNRIINHQCLALKKTVNYFKKYER